MTADAWLTEEYFDWLRSECFSVESERREYEGILRVLHDIPFYWTLPLDVNRAGDAIEYRRSDFLGAHPDLSGVDQHWLNQWALASPSVLEVLLGMARRWYSYFEGSVPYYFGHMFLNMGFHRFPGRHLTQTASDAVRAKADEWMSRQFQSNGVGSPFPVTQALDVLDMRTLDLVRQMNAYSAEHFQ